MQLNTFPVTQKEARQTGAEFSSEKNKNSLFPTRLRELRKEKGVSQQECADTLGVSKSTRACGKTETPCLMQDPWLRWRSITG